MSEKLSKKQQAWLDFYCSVSKMNATDAARRAGYKDPYKSGFENSKKLQQQISQRMKELQEKSGALIMSQQELAEFFSNVTMVIVMKIIRLMLKVQTKRSVTGRLRKLKRLLQILVRSLRFLYR